MFAFVTIATFVFPLFLAYSNAARAMRRVPAFVVTLKSNAKVSGISTPREPKTYSPSVFSRKKVQSMPSSGTATGRTFA